MLNVHRPFVVFGGPGGGGVGCVSCVGGVGFDGGVHSLYINGMLCVYRWGVWG